MGARKKSTESSIKEYRRKHYLANREAYIERAKTFYKLHLKGSFFAKVRLCLRSAKLRAQKRNKEYSINMENFPEQTHCSALPSKKFEFNNSVEDKSTSPSIDCLDPNKGYTPENCWLICHRANRIKNDATFEEFETIYLNWRAELIRRGQLKP